MLYEFQSVPENVMNIDLGANYLQSKFQNTGLLQNKFVEVQNLDKKNA